MTRIVLKASEIAAIIGRNQYKPRQDVLNEMWKKYSPVTFKGLTKKDKAYVALSASENAREALNSARAVHTKSSDEVASVFVNAKAKIEADEKLSTTQKAEVTDFIRSQIYTGHGTRSEDRTADKVVADTGVRLERDDAFHTIPVCQLDDNNFVIVGKIDRIEVGPDGDRTLVEIKNRTNRLFKRVVDYENIQIQVYLQMLGLVHARLVEQYNNQVESHNVDRDDELWTNEILPKLNEFCIELHESMGN
jgi:1,2-phenylacetyl-CoA epoxidase PaaB subunit